jgi:hypothetical protein
LMLAVKNNLKNNVVFFSSFCNQNTGWFSLVFGIKEKLYIYIYIYLDFYRFSQSIFFSFLCLLTESDKARGRPYFYEIVLFLSSKSWNNIAIGFLFFLKNCYIKCIQIKRIKMSLFFLCGKREIEI